MITKVRYYFFIIIAHSMVLLLASQFVCAQESIVDIRPHAGFGYTKNGKNGQDGLSSHIGARFLLSADEYKKYGIELTYIDTLMSKEGSSATRSIATGIVLEKKLWKWFNLSIGSIGYIGVSGNTTNPFGIVTNLGWEPDTVKAIKPFITLRSDFIFNQPVTRINSISLGLLW